MPDAETRFSFAYLIFYSQNIIQISLVKKSKQSSMQSEQMAPMTGFTADFFGALQTTFTDNSLNNSKCDLSQSFANRSQLFREIREESVVKIEQLTGKMVKSIVFEQIFTFALRKKRKQARSPLNMHKHTYKIELMIDMKNSAKCRWAFHQIIKFTKQFSMREISPNINSENNQQIQIARSQGKDFQKTKGIHHNNVLKCAQEKIHHHQRDLIEIGEKVVGGTARVGTLDNSISILKDALPLCDIFIKLFTDRRQIAYGFLRIREYEHYMTRKSYIFEIATFLINKTTREAFLLLLNARNRIKKQQPAKNQLFQLKDNHLQSSRMSKSPKQAENNIQSYGLEQNIRFKKVQKKSTKEEGQAESLSEKKQEKKSLRPTALKFNRCSKKKLESTDQKQEIQQKRSSVSQSKIQSSFKTNKRQKDILVLNQAKQVKILAGPCLKIQAEISQSPVRRLAVWKQFNSFQKSYYLSSQQIKQEVADIPDQMITFEDDLSESKCSSKSKQKALSFSRIHKLDSKKPLEFSNKKQKSKYTSSQKSKKSVPKSDEEEPETFNVQSMKSYYFPEVQKFGKASMIPQRQTSTKFIGSSKWGGGQPKKRISTEVIIRNIKSNEKINPYLHELKERISRKQSEKVINLNKMIERSLSARSNSKNSKGSREDKRRESQQMMKNVQNYKTGKSRNMSPQPHIAHQAMRTPQPGVPKEWNFYQSNVSSVASPVRNLRQSSVKTSLQFQRISKNPKK